MNNNWIPVTEATYLTGKSGVTIRRWCAAHKTNPNAFKKDKGKSYINIDFLKKDYPFINDEQKIKGEETKHKKEAMQLAYNSETIKAQIDQTKAKDEHIKELIKQVNKKSYSWLWVSIGFIILLSVLGTTFYHMFASYQSEQKNNKLQEIKLITSKYDMEVNLKNEVINETKKNLEETKTAYQQTLKAVDLLHVKYNDKLDNERKHYESELKQKGEMLKSEQEKIKQLETKLNELLFSNSERVKQGE
jgi:hypothetical protein